MARQEACLLSHPKCACTTLKHVFYLVNHGRPFVGTGLLKKDGIHEIYAGTSEFRLNRIYLYSSWRRIVVVRDPVFRFLSAYCNRVVDKSDLREPHVGEDARNLSVPINPDLHQFIQHFDKYRAISPGVGHHFAPQASFIGSDIIPIRMFTASKNSMSSMICFRPNAVHDLPWRQRSSISTSVDEISVRELGIIQSLYSGDYALLRKLYSPRAVLERRSSRQAWSRIGRSSVSLQELLPLLDLTVIGSHSVSKDTVVYTEGCHEGVHIHHQDFLTITTMANDAWLVSFRVLTEPFALGESYQLEIEAHTEHKTKITYFVRGMSGDGSSIFPGHDPCHSGTGSFPPQHPSRYRYPTKRSPQSGLLQGNCKFILMFGKMQRTRRHKRDAFRSQPSTIVAAVRTQRSSSLRGAQACTHKVARYLQTEIPINKLQSARF